MKFVFHSKNFLPLLPYFNRQSCLLSAKINQYSTSHELFQSNQVTKRDDLGRELQKIRDLNIVKYGVEQDIYAPPPIEQEKISKIKTEYHGSLSSMFNDETLWFRVYRMPKLSLTRILIRFKAFLTIASISYSLHQLYLCLEDPAINHLMSLSLFGFSSLGLILINGYLRRFILQIYVSEDEKYARFCRLTFWGSRLDMVLPVKSIRPLTENNCHPRLIVLNIELIEPIDLDTDNDFSEFYEEKFAITFYFGGVLDRIKFQNMFGMILHRSKN